MAYNNSSPTFWRNQLTSGPRAVAGPGARQYAQADDEAPSPTPMQSPVGVVQNNATPMSPQISSPSINYGMRKNVEDRIRMSSFQRNMGPRGINDVGARRTAAIDARDAGTDLMLNSPNFTRDRNEAGVQLHMHNIEAGAYPGMLQSQQKFQDAQTGRVNAEAGAITSGAGDYKALHAQHEQLTDNYRQLQEQHTQLIEKLKEYEYKASQPGKPLPAAKPAAPAKPIGLSQPELDAVYGVPAYEKNGVKVPAQPGRMTLQELERFKRGGQGDQQPQANSGGRGRIADNPDQIQEYMRKANGDRNAAAQMAAQDGWDISP